ncbi:MAG: hypothetical protein JW717_02125 [Marinilabiliaceae bacterium]|nr:hypothetical protein [Marinilabiliaceae bacterium]
MNRLVGIFFILSLIMFSCGGNKTDQKGSEEITTEAQDESSSLEKAKDCDEFIDQYEKWMDNYLILVEKYMKNPMDQVLSQEYLKLAQEASNWAQQWSTGFAMCAANEKYEERFEAIAQKAEKKMKELGLE